MQSRLKRLLPRSRVDALSSIEHAENSDEGGHMIRRRKTEKPQLSLPALPQRPSPVRHAFRQFDATGNPRRRKEPRPSAPVDRYDEHDNRSERDRILARMLEEQGKDSRASERFETESMR